MGFIPTGAGSGRMTGFAVMGFGVSSYTPSPGTRAILVECVGAGGAGGGAPSAAASSAGGGGGGGGGYARAYLTTLPASPITVSVGAGGTGVSGATGNAGGDTSFNSGQVLAKGGSPGTAFGAAGSTPSFTPGGLGGQNGPGVGDFKYAGGGGSAGCILSGTSALGGRGGGSSFGSGGTNDQTAALAGINGVGSGCGGSGGVVLNGSAAVAGGSGGNGAIVVWEYA